MEGHKRKSAIGSGNDGRGGDVFSDGFPPHEWTSDTLISHLHPEVLCASQGTRNVVKT